MVSGERLQLGNVTAAETSMPRAMNGLKQVASLSSEPEGSANIYST
jgi:hypothetical protein